MRFEILILGNNSATPAYGRHPTAQILRTNSQQFLIDCGEGTQMRFQQYRVRLKNLNNIFISHLHGDHFYGLIGFITSMNLNGRTNPLNIYCPEGMKEIISIQLKHGHVHLNFDLKYHFTSNKVQELYSDNEILVKSFPLVHRIQTNGFLFRQLKRKLRIKPEKIDELQLGIEEIRDIKEGKDFVSGEKRIPNSELTLIPDLPKSYAFVSDTIYSESYLDHIAGVNLLYHESTFPQELESRAKTTFHTTAMEAARIARKAAVGKLIIGHFSARYQSVQGFLDEAREIFPTTEIAEEGKLFEI